MKPPSTLARSWPLLSAGIIIGSVSISIAWFWPDTTSRLATLAFSGVTLWQGEIWRLVTFLVTHVSLSHLVENVVALVLVTTLAWQLSLPGRAYVAAFIGTSWLVALVEAPLWPELPLAGASVGLLGIVGVTLVAARQWLPLWVTIPLLSAVISAQQGYVVWQTGFSVMAMVGLAAHLLGLWAGVGGGLLARQRRASRPILSQAG